MASVQNIDQVKFVLLYWVAEDTFSTEPLSSIKSHVSMETLLSKDHVYDAVYTQGKNKKKALKIHQAKCLHFGESVIELRNKEIELSEEREATLEAEKERKAVDANKKRKKSDVTEKGQKKAKESTPTSITNANLDTAKELKEERKKKHHALVHASRKTAEKMLNNTASFIVPEAASSSSTCQNMTQNQADQTMPLVQAIQSMPHLPLEPNMPQRPEGQSMPQTQVCQSMPQVSASHSMPHIQVGRSIPNMPAGQSMPLIKEGQSMPQTQSGQSMPPQTKAGQNMTPQTHSGHMPPQPLQNMPTIQTDQNMPNLQAGRSMHNTQEGHNTQTQQQAGQNIPPPPPLQTGQNMPHIQTSQNMQPTVQAGQNISPLEAGQNMPPTHHAGQNMPPTHHTGQTQQQAGQNIPPPLQTGQNMPLFQSQNMQPTVQAGQNISPLEAVHNMPPTHHAGQNMPPTHHTGQNMPQPPQTGFQTGNSLHQMISPSLFINPQHTYTSTPIQPLYSQSSSAINANTNTNPHLTPAQHTQFFESLHTAHDTLYGSHSFMESVIQDSETDTPSNDIHADCHLQIEDLKEKVKFLESKLLERFINQLASGMNAAKKQLRLNTSEVFPSTSALDQHDEVALPTSGSTSFTSESMRIPPADLDVSNSECSIRKGVNQRSETEVELVPGYGVMIGVSQLDVCLRKAKDSPSSLVRHLLTVFFSDEILANSSARGSKQKTGLETAKIDAIIKFVMSHSKTAILEKDVIQAINCKCADVRASIGKKLKIADPKTSKKK